MHCRSAVVESSEAPLPLTVVRPLLLDGAASTNPSCCQFAHSPAHTRNTSFPNWALHFGGHGTPPVSSKLSSTLLVDVGKCPPWSYPANASPSISPLSTNSGSSIAGRQLNDHSKAATANSASIVVIASGAGCSLATIALRIGGKPFPFTNFNPIWLMTVLLHPTHTRGRTAQQVVSKRWLVMRYHFRSAGTRRRHRLDALTYDQHHPWS